MATGAAGAPCGRGGPGGPWHSAQQATAAPGSSRLASVRRQDVAADPRSPAAARDRPGRSRRKIGTGSRRPLTWCTPASTNVNRRRPAPGPGADQDRHGRLVGADLLRQLLDALGRVHRVADDAVIAAAGRTDIADRDHARVDADAHPDRRRPSRPGGHSPPRSPRRSPAPRGRRGRHGRAADRARPRTPSCRRR